ncbi:hypothetical protein [Bacillus alveayuensis]|jgi:hypothetical protein|uniref:ABC transporter periplasmic binding protein yphF n=1 Tax=Aeribacillus alveayuensis TaxID=279215 RepID=A0ABT9VKU4_9BACI|nr:hypothetical protein [Bacillus alveayuensis]MDQ0161524.1 hypothetical protein [Bacillus alveayuensis]
MKKAVNIFIILLYIPLLSGCLYPEERLAKNQIPYEAQIASVQTAVDQYQEKTGGLLPIKTRDMSTPIYQKYPIDFNLLIPEYLSEPPGTAYENGGIYLYVLIDVEEDPTVKLIDLRIAEQIREIKLRINAYRDSHGYPPFKEEITHGVYTLDFQKLGYQEDPQVESPFSNEYLPFVIDSQGEVYVDYRLDLYQALLENGNDVQQGDDIRYLLVEDSPFVPAFSLPYTIDENNEPIFLLN